jgi:hypothetical protein
MWDLATLQYMNGHNTSLIETPVVDACPKCGRVATTPKQHHPLCPLAMLAKKTKAGNFAKR